MVADPLPAWRLVVPGLCAHRGGLAEGPENTLYGMTKGLASGATHLEVDVRGTSDGRAVCLHDKTGERTCLDPGEIEAMTLAEVRALDPCALWSGLAGIATGEREPPLGYGRDWFRVPTLEEVLRHLPGVPLLVDIKDTAPASDVAAAVNAWGRTRDVLLQGYHDEVLDACAEALPDVPRGAGFEGTRAFYEGEEVEADAIVVPREHEGIELVDAGFVARAHEQDKAFWVWTVNEARLATELFEMGVDGIVTDKPSKIGRLREMRLRGVG